MNVKVSAIFMFIIILKDVKVYQCYKLFNSVGGGNRKAQLVKPQDFLTVVWTCKPSKVVQVLTQLLGFGFLKPKYVTPLSLFVKGIYEVKMLR